ncbi:bifunctional riboflavin kinase/FAD synthetase [Formosa algae]|uniref:Riboflavin biosynthesis protein n=1 Tax=Formosa algae TaxID=225843 RepID=A0A9X1CCR6_9FLAO|nr:bifunctional riboflavin kinase/FAD synthetase [Formosa algae]MBP1840409.1 riboflavin kinase/FMN adenylyltransferase [Formosa algae]MDQ0336901.1 riboflavin kinase/FMN adenylyltransferase [Formosa algae]OEI80797.1 riboflavin biosynthesis protein RibF [Formosa algae]PNW28134.1 riboflavin biosynthesis protein RibF [Formosa algae]
MEKVRNFNNLDSKISTVVTIGTFDGVHLGHQKILERLVNTANETHLKSVVLTFFPHPRMVLQNDANIKLINTIEERSAILEQSGVDYLCVQKFTKEFSRLPAEDFVKKILLEQLQAKRVIIGYDHHFGRNRSANIDDLRKFGELYGFEVEEISAEDVDEVAVSSTKIRKALADGAIEKANTYLGYPFCLNGTVVKGKQIGQQLQYPTANLKIEEAYKLIPKHGVYVVKSEIENKTVFGMMNIGNNPTISDSTKQHIEIHFFDFKANLYDTALKIDMLHRLRDEKKFDSIEALKHQLQQDQADSLHFISKLNDK